MAAYTPVVLVTLRFEMMATCHQIVEVDYFECNMMELCRHTWDGGEVQRVMVNKLISPVAADEQSREVAIRGADLVGNKKSKAALPPVPCCRHVRYTQNDMAKPYDVCRIDRNALRLAMPLTTLRDIPRVAFRIRKFRNARSSGDSLHLEAIRIGDKNAVPPPGRGFYRAVFSGCECLKILYAPNANGEIYESGFPFDCLVHERRFTSSAHAEHAIAHVLDWS